MRRDVGDACAHRLSVRAHGDAHRSGVNVVPVALLVRLCQTVHAAGHGARLLVQQVEVVFIPQLHVKGERLAVALVASRSRKRFRNLNRSDIALVGERVADDIRLFVHLRLGRFERVALVYVLLAHRFRHDDIRAVRNVIDHRRLALLQGDRLYVLPSEIDRCRLAVHRVGVRAVNRRIGQRIVLLFDFDVEVKRIAFVGHLAEHVLRDAHAVRVAHVGDLNRGGRFFRNRSRVLFGRAAVPVRIADGKAHVAIRLFVLDNDVSRPFRQVLKGHDLAVMQAQRQRHRLADPLLFHRIRGLFALARHIRAADVAVQRHLLVFQRQGDVIRFRIRRQTLAHARARRSLADFQLARAAHVGKQRRLVFGVHNPVRRRRAKLHVLIVIGRIAPLRESVVFGYRAACAIEDVVNRHADVGFRLRNSDPDVLNRHRAVFNGHLAAHRNLRQIVRVAQIHASRIGDRRSKAELALADRIFAFDLLADRKRTGVADVFQFNLSFLVRGYPTASAGRIGACVDVVALRPLVRLLDGVGRADRNLFDRHRLAVADRQRRFAVLHGQLRLRRAIHRIIAIHRHNIIAAESDFHGKRVVAQNRVARRRLGNRQIAARQFVLQNDASVLAVGDLRVRGQMALSVVFKRHGHSVLRLVVGHAVESGRIHLFNLIGVRHAFPVVLCPARLRNGRVVHRQVEFSVFIRLHKDRVLLDRDVSARRNAFGQVRVIRTGDPDAEEVGIPLQLNLRSLRKDLLLRREHIRARRAVQIGRVHAIGLSAVGLKVAGQRVHAFQHEAAVLFAVDFNLAVRRNALLSAERRARAQIRRGSARFNNQIVVRIGQIRALRADKAVCIAARRHLADLLRRRNRGQIAEFLLRIWAVNREHRIGNIRVVVRLLGDFKVAHRHEADVHLRITQLVVLHHLFGGHRQIEPLGRRAAVSFGHEIAVRIGGDRVVHALPGNHEAFRNAAQRKLIRIAFRTGQVGRHNVPGRIIRIVFQAGKLHRRKQLVKLIAAVGDRLRLRRRAVTVIPLAELHGQLLAFARVGVIRFDRPVFGLHAVAVEVDPDAVAQPYFLRNDRHARHVARHAAVLVIAEPRNVVCRREVNGRIRHLRRRAGVFNQHALLARQRLGQHHGKAVDICRGHARRPAVSDVVGVEIVVIGIPVLRRDLLLREVDRVIFAGFEFRGASVRRVFGHADGRAFQRHIPFGISGAAVVSPVVHVRQFVHHGDVGCRRERRVLHQNSVIDSVDFVVLFGLRAGHGHVRPADKFVLAGNRARHILGNRQRGRLRRPVLGLRRNAVLAFKAGQFAALAVAGLLLHHAGDLVARFIDKRHAEGVLRVLHGLHAAHRIGDVGIHARVVRDNLLQNAFADEQRVHRQGDLLARFQPAVAPDHNRVTVLGYRRRQLQRGVVARRFRLHGHGLTRQRIDQNRRLDCGQVLRLTADILKDNRIMRAGTRAHRQAVALGVGGFRFHGHDIVARVRVLHNLRALHLFGDFGFRQADRRIRIAVRRIRIGLDDALLRLRADGIGQFEARRIAHTANAVDCFAGFLMEAHRHHNRRILPEARRDIPAVLHMIRDLEARVDAAAVFRFQGNVRAAVGHVDVRPNRRFLRADQAVNIRIDSVAFRRRAIGLLQLRKAHLADGHAFHKVLRLHGFRAAVEPAALIAERVHRLIFDLVVRNHEAAHRVADCVVRVRRAAVARRLPDFKGHRLPASVRLRVLQVAQLSADLAVDRRNGLIQIRIAVRDVGERRRGKAAFVRQLRFCLRVPRHACGLRSLGFDIARRSRRFRESVLAALDIRRDDVGIPILLLVRVIRSVLRKRICLFADFKRLRRFRPVCGGRFEVRKRIAVRLVRAVRLRRAELRADDQRTLVFIVALEDHQSALRLVICVEVQRAEQLVRIGHQLFACDDGIIARRAVKLGNILLGRAVVRVRLFEIVIGLVALAHRVQVRLVGIVADRARVRLLKDDIRLALFESRQIREQHVAVCVGGHRLIQIRLSVAKQNLVQFAFRVFLHDVKHSAFDNRRIIVAVASHAAEHANLNGYAARIHHRNRVGLSARRQINLRVIRQLIAVIRRGNLFDVIGVQHAVRHRVFRRINFVQLHHAVRAGFEARRVFTRARPVAKRRAAFTTRIIALIVLLVQHIQREEAIFQRSRRFAFAQPSGLLNLTRHPRAGVDKVNLHLALNVHRVVTRDGHVPAAGDPVVRDGRAVVNRRLRVSIQIGRRLGEPVARAFIRAFHNGVCARIEPHDDGLPFSLGEASERNRLLRHLLPAFGSIGIDDAHFQLGRFRRPLLIDIEGDVFRDALRVRRLKRLGDFQIRARRVGHIDGVIGDRHAVVRVLAARVAPIFERCGSEELNFARVALALPALVQMLVILVADDAEPRRKQLPRVHLSLRNRLDQLIPAGIQAVKRDFARFGVRCARMWQIHIAELRIVRFALELALRFERAEIQGKIRRNRLQIRRIAAPIADLVKGDARRRRVVNRNRFVSLNVRACDRQRSAVEQLEILVDHCVRVPVFSHRRFIQRLGNRVLGLRIIARLARAIIPDRQAENDLALFVRGLSCVRQLASVAAQNLALAIGITNLNRRVLDQLPIRVPLDDGQRMETRIRGADGNLALVLARGERQSVGRRAVHIPAVKHKTALVGLHALDYRRGCLFNRELRLARQLHRRLIMVRVVQRDTGIRLAFCIRDGVNRIRASLSAVIAFAVHILGDRQIGHLAEDVLDGVVLSVFVQIIVYNRHVIRILRILDSLHMQGIPLLHINHVNRVILLAEDEIGLVEGLSVFIHVQLHRVIRICRAAVFRIERLQRNGDAHAVARAHAALAACDKFCAELAVALDGLQQAVRVFARKQEFKGHARQRPKLVDPVVVLRFGGRPVFLIQLHLEQTLELGLPAAHHIGLVVCVHFRHGIDRSRRSRPHAAVDLLIAACVVDLHLPEQEGIFADVVAQLKSVRHERARAHAARAGFIGDSVSNQFALLRFGGENSFQLRFPASIFAFFHRVSRLRRFKRSVAVQQFALFFRQVARADGVNLKLAVIQPLRLVVDNAFRRAVCKLNRVADLVQLQLHIVLVIGDAALAVVLIIGLFARQFNIFEVTQHILIIARLSVVRRVFAVRMIRIIGLIGAVSVRNFRFHEHIVLEAVQIGDRLSRVRHVERLNLFKLVAVLHFVERHRRARQRILRRVAALQLIFLLVVQADVESGLRLIFKRQRLAGIFVQLELLLVFRLEIFLRRLLLLHRVRQHRVFVVRIAVNRQAGQLKRLACALFARVNQRVRRFVEHKAGFQQRLIGIAVLREVRRVHRDRELRQIRRVHIIDGRGLRAQLFLLLVAQLNRQAADVRRVDNSRIVRPIRLAIRQRPKDAVVEHHVAGNRRFPDIVRAVSRDGEHADRLIRLAHRDRLTDLPHVLVIQGKRRKAAVRHLVREIFGHLKLILPLVNLSGLPAVVARRNRQRNEFRIQIVVLRCGQLLQIIGSSFLHREHQFNSAVRVRREAIRVRHIFGLGQAPRFIHNGRRLFRQHAVRRRPPDQIGRAIRFPGQHGINRAGQCRVVAAFFGEGRLADLTRVGDGDCLARTVVQRHALLAVRHRIAFRRRFDDGIGHHMAVFVPAAQRKGLACLVLFAVGRQFNRPARQRVARFAGSLNRDRPRLFFVQAAHIDKPLRDG